MKQSLIQLLGYHFMTGYSTHMVGKWHLGFFKWPYTPTYRGFDSFYGLYTGYVDHYKYTNRHFLDLRDNMKPVHDKEGVYSTTLFTEVIYQLYIKNDHILTDIRSILTPFLNAATTNIVLPNPLTLEKPVIHSLSPVPNRLSPSDP